MPILFLFGFLTLCGVSSIKDELSMASKRNCESDTDKMLVSMIGKTKRECRKIAKMYNER